MTYSVMTPSVTTHPVISYVVLFVMCAVFSPEAPQAYDWASGCGDRDGGQERDGDDYVEEVH